MTTSRTPLSIWSAKLSSQKPVNPPVAPDNAAPPWSRRRVSRGIQVFVGLTLVALLILFVRGRLGTSFTAIAHMSWPIVVLCISQGLVDLLMGGLRIQVLVQAFGSLVPLRMAIVANGGNLFLGGLTPSQTGGGPAQLYALMRAGVSARVALIASLVSWLGTIFFFLLAGLIITVWQPVTDLHGGYRFFSGATVVVFSIIVALFLFAIPKPTLYRGRFRAALSLVPFWGQSWGHSRRVRQLEIGLAMYARLMRVAIRQHPWRLSAGFALSILIYLNKFGMAWVDLDGKIHNFKTLVDEKGLSVVTLEKLSNELKEAYVRGQDEARFSARIGEREVVVTPSESLASDVSKIIRKFAS